MPWQRPGVAETAGQTGVVIAGPVKRLHLTFEEASRRRVFPAPPPMRRRGANRCCRVSYCDLIPNVLYELAVRHAVNKPAIPAIERGSQFLLMSRRRRSRL